MELCADVALDLGQRLVRAEAGAVGPVAGHRIEAVGDDEELRGEWLVGGRDPVVAAAVVALAVVLDGAGLGGGDLEPAQQASREARRAPDRAPFVRPELAGLAQDGRVDRDLPEVVQPRGPAQAVDVGVGQAERAGERVDVAGDADRVAVGRGVALVDDVREGLEGVERFLP